VVVELLGHLLVVVVWNASGSLPDLVIDHSHLF
jgi:hypothetical protein